MEYAFGRIRQLLEDPNATRQLNEIFDTHPDYLTNWFAENLLEEDTAFTKAVMRMSKTNQETFWGLLTTAFYVGAEYQRQNNHVLDHA